MSRFVRSRSLAVLRRSLAGLLVGVVILLGVSACLTRTGGAATDPSGAVVSLLRPASAEGAAATPLRRCAFSILVALPERRADLTPLAAAEAVGARRAADDRLPEGRAGETLERPPRDGVASAAT